jgi:hypothetical protein
MLSALLNLTNKEMAERCEDKSAVIKKMKFKRFLKYLPLQNRC